MPAEQWEVGHVQLGYLSHVDCIYTSWPLYSTNRNVVVAKSMLLQLNVVHKDATVSQLQMLVMLTSKI